MAKKIDTSYQARMDGMVYALRLVEKEGIEALKKDIEFRGANFVPLEINRETMVEIYGMLAARITQTMLTMVLATLRDSKGWGRKRLKDFKERFEKKVHRSRCFRSKRGTLRAYFRLCKATGKRMWNQDGPGNDFEGAAGYRQNG